MGSRAVVIICRDEQSSRQRFGVEAGEIGTVFTRTGRRFFSDQSLNEHFWSASARRWIARASGRNWTRTGHASTASFCPGQRKHKSFCASQYAPVGASGLAALPRAVAALKESSVRLEGDEKEKASLLEESFRRRELDVSLSSQPIAATAGASNH